MKLNQLLENVWGTYYTVRRVAPDTLEVSKFEGHSEPEHTYTVVKKKDGTFRSDSPGYHKLFQKERSVRLAKQFIEDDEPWLAHYTVDDDGKITSHRSKEIPKQR